ncbi:hypothetical protein [Elioraea sp.]|uniref:hypothetical protein n=1 Tax=Elioraea sp. TaxID=2185103 RepID=UPI003F70CF08
MAWTLCVSSVVPTTSPFTLSERPQMRPVLSDRIAQNSCRGLNILKADGFT